MIFIWRRLLAETHVLAEGERDHAQQPVVEPQRQHRDRVAVPALSSRLGKSLLRSARDSQEERLAAPKRGDVRHGQLGLDRELARLLEDRVAVAALCEQRDRAAVLAQEPDRARAGLGRPEPFGEDRVEHLLRRERSREPPGDALKAVCPVGGLASDSSESACGSTVVIRLPPAGA